MSLPAPTRAPGSRRRPRRTLRVGSLSGTYRLRQLAVPLVALVVLVLLAALSLGRGDYPISVPQVLGTLIGLGDDTQRFIVTELRAPRIVAAVLVGVALGVSGALIQTFARNPLASPDILGVTGGAAIGAGAVLVGVALSAMSTAIVQYLLTRSDIRDAASANVWITGSLNGRGWDDVLPLVLSLLVLLPAALALTRVLDVLQFGDETARALGVRVPLAQGAVVVVAVGLAAFAVSAAGPIQFVALVVPQVAVRLTGGSRPPLVASGLLGALLLVGSDLVARTVLPESFPVGVVTAVVGAPYLLWLLVRGRRRSTL